MTMRRSAFPLVASVLTMLTSDRGLELYESSTTVNPSRKRKTSPRISEGAAVESAAAISSAETPKYEATAEAASAFRTLCLPCIGSTASASPVGVSRRNRLVPTPTVSSPTALTSAASRMP